MPGPLHFPRVIAMFPFRYRDSVTGKWVRARYRAELHEIRARYREWETTGLPEFRYPTGGGSFNPWRSTKAAPRRPGRWKIVGVAS
jgi:hypothetical protein